MKNTSNCNACDIDDCPSVGKIPFNCKVFRPLEPFKTPLLMHCLMDDRKAQGAVEVLAKFKIKIYEVHYYPYFKLRLE